VAVLLSFVGIVALATLEHHALPPVELPDASPQAVVQTDAAVAALRSYGGIIWT